MCSISLGEISISLSPICSRKRDRSPKIERRENSAGKSETCIQNFDNDLDTGTSFVDNSQPYLEKNVADNTETLINGTFQDISCDTGIEEVVVSEYDSIIKLDNELFVNSTLSEMLDLCEDKIGILNAFDKFSVKAEPADKDKDSKFKNSESSFRECIQNSGMNFSFNDKNFKIFPQEISETSSAVLNALDNKDSAEYVNAKQKPLDDFSEKMTSDLANVACAGDMNIKQEASDDVSEELTQITFKTESKYKEYIRSSEKSRDLANVSHTGGMNVKQETSDDFSDEMTRKTIKTERKLNDGDKNLKTGYKLANENQATNIFADSRISRDPILHSRNSLSQYMNNTVRAPSNSESNTQEYSGDNDNNCLFENKAIFAKYEIDKESLNYNNSRFLNDSIRIKKETGNDYGDNTFSNAIDDYKTSINRKEEFERNCGNTRKRIKIEPNFNHNGEDANARDAPCVKKEIPREDCRGRENKCSLSDCNFYLNTKNTTEFHTDKTCYPVNEDPILNALKKENDPLKNKSTSVSLLSKTIQIKEEVRNNTGGDITPKETDIFCNIPLKRKKQDEEIEKDIIKKIKNESISVVYRKDKQSVKPKRIKSELLSNVSPNEKEEIILQKIKSERNSAFPEKHRNFQVLALSHDDGKFSNLSENENKFMALFEDSDKIEEISRIEMKINRISAVESPSSDVSDLFSKNEDLKRTSEKKDLSSKILKDFSVEKKSDNCEEDYLNEVKREKSCPEIIRLNVKDYNDSKMTRNLKLNPIQIFHSEITCSSSPPPDWYCFEETSKKKISSIDILKYFSVASQLDRVDILNSLVDLEKLKTKNNFKNLFNIPKKPNLRTSFENRDILFQNSPNTENEKTGNNGGDYNTETDVKFESETMI